MDLTRQSANIVLMGDRDLFRLALMAVVVVSFLIYRYLVKKP